MQLLIQAVLIFKRLTAEALLSTALAFTSPIDFPYDFLVSLLDDPATALSDLKSSTLGLERLALTRRSTTWHIIYMLNSEEGFESSAAFSVWEAVIGVLMRNDRVSVFDLGARLGYISCVVDKYRWLFWKWESSPMSRDSHSDLDSGSFSPSWHVDPKSNGSMRFEHFLDRTLLRLIYICFQRRLAVLCSNIYI